MSLNLGDKLYSVWVFNGVNIQVETVTSLGPVQIRTRTSSNTEYRRTYNDIGRVVFINPTAAVFDMQDKCLKAYQKAKANLDACNDWIESKQSENK